MHTSDCPDPCRHDNECPHGKSNLAGESCVACEALEPWACPWCGVEAEIINQDLPDSMRGIKEYEEWLEAHVGECDTWLTENNNYNN